MQGNKEKTKNQIDPLLAVERKGTTGCRELQYLALSALHSSKTVAHTIYSRTMAGV